jgi:hypothetical protein
MICLEARLTRPVRTRPCEGVDGRQQDRANACMQVRVYKQRRDNGAGEGRSYHVVEEKVRTEERKVRLRVTEHRKASAYHHRGYA